MTDQELLELKGWGHQLLKVLADKMGVDEGRAYSVMARALNISNKDAHFSTMNAAQTKRAVNVLIKLNKKVSSQQKKATTKQLPINEIKQILANHQPNPKMPSPKRRFFLWLSDVFRSMA